MNHYNSHCKNIVGCHIRILKESLHYTLVQPQQTPAIYELIGSRVESLFNPAQI